MRQKNLHINSSLSCSVLIFFPCRCMVKQLQKDVYLAPKIFFGKKSEKKTESNRWSKPFPIFSGREFLMPRRAYFRRFCCPQSPSRFPRASSRTPPARPLPPRTGAASGRGAVAAGQRSNGRSTGGSRGSGGSRRRQRRRKGRHMRAPR